MAYIQRDNDLEFLAKASHEDLKLFVDILMKDPSDGRSRLTEELSTKLEKSKDYTSYWEDIVDEFIRDSKALCYREILTDVCDNIKVNYAESSDIQTIERHFS